MTQTQAIETGAAGASLPDEHGHFGLYGGRFVAETLMLPLEELTAAYRRYLKDPEFLAELDSDLAHYVGRPSPLYHAERLSAEFGGARIYLKREDLNHTGAHKINNTVGQALLAKRMGKKRVIAETGAGQHGVATATVAARFGMECVVYMGAEDIRRQAINVYRMRLLGAEVVAGHLRFEDPEGCAERGDARLGDQCRQYFLHHRYRGRTASLSGHGAGFPGGHRPRGPRPDAGADGRLPDALVACVGGGSNAIGLFYPFLNDARVAMDGVEAGGDGIATGRHAAPLCAGRPGVLHGNRTYLMEDADGQIIETHSISAGLDYPGVGPEHAWLKDSGRAKYRRRHRRRGAGGFP